jgi:hypothetical protein
MRRLVQLSLVITALLIAGAGDASAKGIPEHAKVMITGAGLPGGTVTLGDDGGAFALGSQPWQEKWDAPNVGGTLEPDADLGPAYAVRVVLDCEGGARSRYRQTLYPEAPGGPQLLTPTGVDVCGDPAPAGYDALGPGLTTLLRRHGVDVRPRPTPTPTTTSPSSSGSSVPALAAVGVPFVLVALVGGEIVRRRRRR